jgi:HEAT repeat protein
MVLAIGYCMIISFALRYIGGEAKTTVPALILLLKDSDADVRHNAASALVN